MGEKVTAEERVKEWYRAYTGRDPATSKRAYQSVLGLVQAAVEGERELAKALEAYSRDVACLSRQISELRQQAERAAARADDWEKVAAKRNTALLDERERLRRLRDAARPVSIVLTDILARKEVAPDLIRRVATELGDTLPATEDPDDGARGEGS